MERIKEVHLLIKTSDMLTEGFAHEKQDRVRVRHMRQPTAWIVPNPDLGDRPFRDKGHAFHVLKSNDGTRRNTQMVLYFGKWCSEGKNLTPLDLS